MIRSLWLALSLVVAAPLAANEIPSAERERLLRNLLVQDCGSCHGLTMRGGLGPALQAANLKGKSNEYLSQVILHGRPGTAMPPWKSMLSPSEARWMAEQLLQENLQ